MPESSTVAVLKDSPEGQNRLAQSEQTRKPADVSSHVGKKVEDVIPEKSKIEPPLSIYEKEYGKPYTVDYFKIPEWEMLDDETDIEKTRDKVKFIEKWVKEHIAGEKLEDSLDSYRQIIGRYMAELNVVPTEKLESKFERLSIYLGLLKKQKDLDVQKKMVINKCQVNPKRVSSSEYYQYLDSLGLTGRKD